MEIKVERWGKFDTMNLSEYLTPEIDQEPGIVETAEAQGRKNAKVIGKLLTLLVEKQILTIDEAAESTGGNVWGWKHAT